MNREAHLIEYIFILPPSWVSFYSLPLRAFQLLLLCNISAGRKIHSYPIRWS